MTGPRLLADLDWVLAQSAAGTAGAVWQLQEQDRQLDADLVRLPADERVELRHEPDDDVLLLPLYGAGTLHTDAGHAPLVPHALMWLPRGSRRTLVAGPEGLAYVTVQRTRAAQPDAAPAEDVGSGNAVQRSAGSGRERTDGTGRAAYLPPRLCPRCGAPREAAINRTCSNCGAALTA